MRKSSKASVPITVDFRKKTFILIVCVANKNKINLSTTSTSYELIEGESRCDLFQMDALSIPFEDEFDVIGGGVIFTVP